MTKHKVVLINPQMCKPSGVRLPLSILALAAALESRYDYELVDGNVVPDVIATTLAALAGNGRALVGITVMPGPQVAPAIELSRAIRTRRPDVPIVWGGYFPTLYAAAAMNAAYVDYVVRGPGEDILLELLEGLGDAGAIRSIAGLSWKDGGEIVHNPARKLRLPNEYPSYPYYRLGNVQTYLRPSFMGTRTGVHQAALGCRYHCTFCGVVSMFNGFTAMEPAQRIDHAFSTLRGAYGANAMQFYDHNFFDTERTSMPAIEVLARTQVPWWCYARADTLANFPAATWELLRKSRLTMAYIGAEAGSDEVLRRMRKGSRASHTFEVARKCREYGVIPEFSFVLGGPEDPEGEIERTLSFVRRVKEANPECEIILYFYSPTPQRAPGFRGSDPNAPVLPVLNGYGPNGPDLPATPEEWTQPQWINYVCHQDAPWLSPKMRQRVKDFAKVLACRFPTVQDYSTAPWGKAVLRGLATPRYLTGRYSNPWELDLVRKLIPLRQPQVESI